MEKDIIMEKGKEKSRVLVLSNITHEPYLSKCIKMNPEMVWEPEYCNLSENREIDVNGYDCVLVWINYEQLIQYLCSGGHSIDEDVVTAAIDYCKLFLANVMTDEAKNIIYVSFENFYDKSYWVQGNQMDESDKMNLIDLQMCELFKHANIIDIKKVIARVGIENAYDEKNGLRWNSPYSKFFYMEIVKDINRICSAKSRVQYKCLALDCDNVMWGGILSEQEIALGDIGEGKKYKEFQRFLHFLFRKGYILTVLSKNDKEDVIKVFREDEDMVIKEEHISYFGVSWNKKSDEIRKMADFLHIGLDSIVFIDDSTFEIAQMKKECPSVTSVLYHPDTIYRELSMLNVSGKNVLEQSILRTLNFKTDVEREELERNSISHEAFLSEIQTVIDIKEAQKYEYERIAELSQRVNRVSNGQRYNQGELHAKAKDAVIYSVHVKDKFGDLGLVGAMVVHSHTLCMFSLSCRALGRNIEKEMISFLTDKHAITASVFYDTRKNEDVKKLLEQFRIEVLLPAV